MDEKKKHFTPDGGRIHVYTLSEINGIGLRWVLRELKSEPKVLLYYAVFLAPMRAETYSTLYHFILFAIWKFGTIIIIFLPEYFSINLNFKFNYS